MKSKTITMVLPNLNAGGAEQVSLVLANGLIRYGHKVNLVLFERSGEFLDRVPEGVRIFSPSGGHNKLVRLLHSFPILISVAKDSDIVLAALELSPTYLCYFTKIITGKPVIAWLHIDLLEYFKRLKFYHKYLMRFVYPSFDAIVAVSDGVKSSFFQAVKVKGKAKINRIFNINDSLVSNDEVLGKCDILKNGSRFILAVGRLSEQKGFDILINAFSIYAKNKQDLSLVIVGEGSEREHLELLISALNLESKVHLVGYKSDLSWYYKNCWLFVHPARFEGLGMVLIEAMSYGCPVIATDCPSGPAEILSGGRYGVLSPVCDVNGLVDNIGIMENDVVYSKYADLSLIRANEFSYSHIIPEWEGLFSQILNQCDASS